MENARKLTLTNEEKIQALEIALDSREKRLLALETEQKDIADNLKKLDHAHWELFGFGKVLFKTIKHWETKLGKIVMPKGTFCGVEF